MIWSDKPPKITRANITSVILRLSNSNFHNILGDLVKFTGLSVEQVAYRIARKMCAGYGARGWFYDEYAWHAPKDEREIAWFYRCSQSYLFSNARIPWWPMIDWLEVDDGPVLEFGGGVGTTALELALRGFKVWFYEPSLIQTDFVRFRLQSHGHLFTIMNNAPVDGFDSFNPLNVLPNGLQFGTVVLKDVLEHVPKYYVLLSHILRRIGAGGKLLEHSPFGSRHVHFRESVPMAKIMKKEGFELLKKHVEGPRLWQRIRK
jgi:hypothetical protein